VDELRKLLLNAPVIVVVYDGKDARIELFSHLARAAVGGRDLTGCRLDDEFPEIADYFRHIMDTVKAGRPFVGVNEPFTLDWTGQGKPETRYLSFYYQPVLGDHGTVERSILFAVDVTTLVGPSGVTGDLAWLYATLDCVPTPIVLAEPGTARIAYANTAARHLSRVELPAGAKFAQAVGTDVGVRCTDPSGAPIDEHDLPAARAARGEVVDGMEILFHTPRGVLSLVCFAETVRGTPTLPSFVVLSFFDVTVLRRAEREVQEARAGREVFMTLVAHELRTPLTALKLHTRGLLRKSPGSDGVAAIARSAARMEDLVETMLQAQEIQAFGVEPRPEELDLCEVAEGVIQDLRAEAEQARCPVSRVGARELRGSWDRELVERVLRHLLRNAFRFGSGGPVCVACTDLVERVAVAVSDRGIGIHPQDQERIFDRYGRAVSCRNFGGLGLGLWIARTTVQAMGGSIAVQSSPGKGAVFTIELPRSHLK